MSFALVALAPAANEGTLFLRRQYQQCNPPQPSGGGRVSSPSSWTEKLAMSRVGFRRAGWVSEALKEAMVLRGILEGVGSGVLQPMQNWPVQMVGCSALGELLSRQAGVVSDLGAQVASGALKSALEKAS